MKTKSDHIRWWNTLNKTAQNDYALEYYGVDSSYMLDEEISAVYYDTQRYYIEFDGKRSYLCIFPPAQKDKNKDFKTLNEALDYMLVDCKVKEVIIKN